MNNVANLPENFINWEESVVRVGDDEDFLLELLNDLKVMVKKYIEKIGHNLSESNYREIRELVHSLKGASGNLGLNIMYNTTLNLENSAKEENKDKIKKYFNDLESDYQNLELLLNSK